MNRVMLVDDEFLSICALRNLINWSEYGYLLDSVASNGQEALKIIPHQKPDLMFIDISMPVMDGIELLRHVRKHYSDIDCIMLSSYSDYRYVREALKLGAHDYLLKHQINASEILRIISSLHPNSIPSNNEATSSEDSEEKLRRFFTGIEPFPLLPPVFPLIIKLSRKVGDMDILRILSTCRCVLCSYKDVYVVDLANQEFVIFFRSIGEQKDYKESFASQINETAQVIVSAIRKYHNLSSVYVLGEEVNDTDKVKNCISAYRAEAQQKEAQKLPAKKDHDDLDQNLLGAVISHDLNLLTKIIREHFEKAPRNPCPNQVLTMNVSELLRIAYSIQEKLGLSIQQLDEKNIRAIPPLEQIPWIEKVYIDLAETAHQRRNEKIPAIIQQTIAYIEQNYTKQISLDRVAKSCCVNAAYLSSLFKKNIGIGLTQFINQLRIQRSMYLMLFENIPATTACLQVGYNNYSHFYTKFKDIMHCSPTDYVQAHDAKMRYISFDPYKKQAYITDGSDAIPTSGQNS